MNAKQQYQIMILRNALEMIVNPLPAITTLPPKEQMHGYMANVLADNPEFLRTIARRALEEFEILEGKNDAQKT